MSAYERTREFGMSVQCDADTSFILSVGGVTMFGDLASNPIACSIDLSLTFLFIPIVPALGLRLRETSRIDWR